MYMKPVIVVATALTAMFFTCAAQAGEIKVGGGGGPLDSIIKPVKEPFEKASGEKLSIVFSSATLAFKQLAAGEVDASAAGVSYEDLQKSLKKEGFDIPDPGVYTATTIGKGRIYIVLNKDNPVSKLSKEQIKGIFTGQIANWKDVGGSDSPIIIVYSKINPATNAAFQKLAMDGANFSNDVLDAGRFEDVRDKIASNPEAVGFGPGTMIDATIKTPEVPDFSRPIILVTKGKPSPKVQKLLDYIKGDGQKYVKN